MKKQTRRHILVLLLLILICASAVFVLGKSDTFHFFRSIRSGEEYTQVAEDKPAETGVKQETGKANDAPAAQEGNGSNTAQSENASDVLQSEDPSEETAQNGDEPVIGKTDGEQNQTVDGGQDQAEESQAGQDPQPNHGTQPEQGVAPGQEDGSEQGPTPKEETDPVPHTVTFDGNGGVCTLESVTTTESTLDVYMNMGGSGVSKENYVLVAWSTSSDTDLALSGDASVKTYSTRKIYTLDMSDDVTLYAIWADEFDIVYHDMGGGDFTGTHGSPVYTKYHVGESISLDAPTLEGYSFAGWSTLPHFYNCITVFTSSMLHFNYSSITPSNINYFVNGSTTIDLYAAYTADAIMLEVPADYEIEDLKGYTWGIKLGSGIGESLAELNLQPGDLIFMDCYGVEHTLFSYDPTVNDEHPEGFYFDDEPIFYVVMGQMDNSAQLTVTGGTRSADPDVIRWFRTYGVINYYPLTGGSIDQLYSNMSKIGDAAYQTALPVFPDTLDKVFTGYKQKGSTSRYEDILYDPAAETFAFGVYSNKFGNNDTGWTLGSTFSSRYIEPAYETISLEITIGNLQSKRHVDHSDLFEWAASPYNDESVNSCKEKFVFIDDGARYLLGVITKGKDLFTKEDYTISGVDVYSAPSEGIYAYTYFKPEVAADGDMVIFEGNAPAEPNDIYLTANWNAVRTRLQFDAETYSNEISFRIAGVSYSSDKQNGSLAAWIVKYGKDVELGMDSDLVWIKEDGSDNKVLGYFYYGEGVDTGTETDGIKVYQVPEGEYAYYYLTSPSNYADIQGKSFSWASANNLIEFTVDGKSCWTDSAHDSLVEWGSEYSASQDCGQLMWIEIDDELRLGFDVYGSLVINGEAADGLPLAALPENEPYHCNYLSEDSGAAIANGASYTTAACKDIVRFTLAGEEKVTYSAYPDILSWLRSPLNTDGYAFQEGYSLSSKGIYIGIPYEDALLRDFTLAGIPVYYYAEGTEYINAAAYGSGSVTPEAIITGSETVPEGYESVAVYVTTDAIPDGRNYSRQSNIQKTYTTCFTADTVITMADGSTLPVWQLKAGDVVRTFDHNSGAISASPVSYIFKNSGSFETVRLSFAGGAVVSVINEHGFFNEEENRYVQINRSNAESYIGKHFYNADLAQYVELESVAFGLYSGEVYSVVTEYHINAVAGEMLSVSDDIEGLYNLFEYGEGLRISAEEVEKSVAAYGLLSYEELQAWCPTEVFDKFNLKYLKIAFAKGLTTKESVINRLKLYFKN